MVTLIGKGYSISLLFAVMLVFGVLSVLVLLPNVIPQLVSLSLILYVRVIHFLYTNYRREV